MHFYDLAFHKTSIKTSYMYVYTLPTNANTLDAPTLQPRGDVAFLQEKFKRDPCAWRGTA